MTSAACHFDRRHREVSGEGLGTAHPAPRRGTGHPPPPPRSTTKKRGVLPQSACNHGVVRPPFRAATPPLRTRRPEHPPPVGEGPANGQRRPIVGRHTVRPATVAAGPPALGAGGRWNPPPPPASRPPRPPLFRGLTTPPPPLACRDSFPSAAFPHPPVRSDPPRILCGGRRRCHQTTRPAGLPLFPTPARILLPAAPIVPA